MTIETEESGTHWAGQAPQRLAPAGLLAALRRWLEHRRTRRSLLSLSPEELRDIGMSREAARAEMRKSWFWD